jgi:inorganic triphosphatase YgiF
VLADRLSPPRAGVGKHATVGEVVLTYLAEQAEAIQATDSQVRRGARDSVHAMRVACRRMRSTMQSFRAVLDRDRTDGLVAELRWLAGQLGGARDFEVQVGGVVTLAVEGGTYTSGRTFAENNSILSSTRSWGIAPKKLNQQIIRPGPNSRSICLIRSMQPSGVSKIPMSVLIVSNVVARNLSRRAFMRAPSAGEAQSPAAEVSRDEATRTNCSTAGSASCRTRAAESPT